MLIEMSFNGSIFSLVFLVLHEGDSPDYFSVAELALTSDWPPHGVVA